MICKTCKQDKAEEFFYLRKDSNKRRTECKDCIVSRNKDNKSRNPEQYALTDRLRYARNPQKQLDRCKKRYWENPTKKNAAAKQWRQNNPDKVNRIAAYHRAAKKQRTASWANMEEIAVFYKTAKLLEMLTDEKWHVDHIIPLHGELVSGLHVETNLQLLKAQDNLSKQNSFIVN